MDKTEKSLRKKMERLSRCYEEIYGLCIDVGIQELGRTERKIMSYLASAKKPNITSITRSVLFEGISLSTANRVIKKLLDDNYLIKSLKDIEDRREVMLEINYDKLAENAALLETIYKKQKHLFYV